MLNLKKLITRELRETKRRAEILEEYAEVRRKKIRDEFNLDKGLDGVIRELGEIPNKPAWVGLLKLRKLILEIRYLENNGDTDSECLFEADDAANHCKGLVGIIKAFDATKRLDARIRVDIGEQGEEFYLVNYFRFLAFDKSTSKLDPSSGISLIRSDKDELMEGIELEKRLGLYKEHFDGWITKHGKLNSEEDEKLKKAIDDELAKDAPEDALAWRNKLKEIDPVLDDPALINDAWKDEWTALNKFKEGDKVKALFNKIKGKADFLTELPTLSGETGLNTLTLMAAKKPKEIIRYIESYWYNHLSDTDTDEKKKEKTQMKRRIAKALNKTKESDLSDADIPENLVKIKTGELLVDMTKTYNAELKEIKTKIPEDNDKKETKELPFLRWNNPWVYAIGALVIGIVGVAIFWDKLVSLFSGDKEER